MMPLLGFFGFEFVSATLITGASGTYVNGEWQKGTTTSGHIRIISPQPVSLREIDMLEDGEHIKDFKKTWTENTAVSPREGDKDADQIVWQGTTYKVVAVGDREEFAGFEKIIMKKVS